MLGALARKLGLRGRARQPWLRALAERHVDPRVLDGLAAHDDLERAWRACARLDWALAIAIRARVEPALVLAGWAGIATEGREWPGAATRVDAVAALLEAWRRDELEAAVVLDMMVPNALALVEHAPEVTKALTKLREVERWRQRALIQQIADAYDLAHAAAHAQLSERFRRSVSYEALRFALEGHARSPYR